ncbi:MAG: hypothetical protein JWR16_281 [Nevskia sp.]|nr:hypothetical protein [Nevskia sp.]
MGSWGRALGFVIATAYFSLMDSRLFDGQSLGARLSKIKVLARTGRPLGIGASALRTIIFTLPYCLNGAPILLDPSITSATILLSVVVFGVGLSTIYLFVFNRSTRQCLHDWAVGAYVVKTEHAQPIVVGSIWRGHFVVIAAIVLAAVLVPLYVPTLAKQAPFSELIAIQHALQQVPGVGFATVNKGTNTFTSFGKGTTTTDILSVRVFLSKKLTSKDELANKLAKVVLDTYPSSAQEDRILISMSYGFDIGIASQWHTENVSLSPAEWRNRLGPPVSSDSSAPPTTLE